jgi:drug/metabolite transporter (DMT)-like permease
MKKSRMFLFLHLLLLLYSFSEICSKKASEEGFLTLRFFLFYGGVFLFLGIYAIGWQQIIRFMPLTLAYANKAVTVIWGMIWGVLFFQEKITFCKILGAVFVMTGIIIFAREEKEHD